MERLLRRLAGRIILEEISKAYLEGLEQGREERPMTCGISSRNHCVHDYLYDPGQ